MFPRLSDNLLISLLPLYNYPIPLTINFLLVTISFNIFSELCGKP